MPRQATSKRHAECAAAPPSARQCVWTSCPAGTQMFHSMSPGCTDILLFQCMVRQISTPCQHEGGMSAVAAQPHLWVLLDHQVEETHGLWALGRGHRRVRPDDLLARAVLVLRADRRPEGHADLFRQCVVLSKECRVQAKRACSAQRRWCTATKAVGEPTAMKATYAQVMCTEHCARHIRTPGHEARGLHET